MSFIQNQEELKREAYKYFNDHIRPFQTKIDEHGSMRVIDLYPDDPNINTGTNDDIDAFRHAYVMGKIAMYSPNFVPQWEGMWHEYTTTDSIQGHDMDIWNNYVGIKMSKIATSTDELGSLLKIALENRELITSPREMTPEEKTQSTSAFTDFLNSLLTSSQTISSTITDFLFSLTQAEAMQFSARRDPLTLDLNHNNQIDLISLNDSNAFFDLSGDGIKNKVGWVGGNDNNNDGIIDDANNNGTRLDDADGFLVLDANNNNVVDNINELFGYQDANGNIVEGTEELATHDSNHDGRIDASDAVFNQLKIWQDFNGNGTTDAGEISTLADHNITTINVNNTTTTNQNIDGNVIISTGAYNYTDPNNANQTAGILANLNLAIDQTNSSAYTYQDEQGNTISYNLNLETLTLPFSRGYGFFREKNANSIFRKNETFLRSKKSRARVVFKPQAQKSDEALTSSKLIDFLVKSDEVFLVKNSEAFLKPANDNFVNQNLLNQNPTIQLCVSE